MATPMAGPMMAGNSKSGMIVDSPAGGGMVFPNAIMPRSLHDEIWPGSRMRPSSPMVTNAGMVGGGTMLPMSVSAANSSSAEASLQKLNPSVYSHPNAQDPVLMLPKSYLHHPNHRDLAVLGGRRANVDMTSSGAFFDPRAVSKMGKDTSQMEILAQLTREMRLQQQAGSGIFSYSSDAVSSSSGGSGNHLNQILTTPPTTSGQSLSNNSSPSKLAVASSSGYNTGNSSGQFNTGGIDSGGGQAVIENRRQNLKANSTSSLITTEASGNNATSSNPPNNEATSRSKNADVVNKSSPETLVTSLSQPDLYSSLDSPQSEAGTVVTYAVNSSHNNNSNSAAAASIMETLKNDNRDMKAEILDLRKKVSKVTMLEEEMSKVHQVLHFILVGRYTLASPSTFNVFRLTRSLLACITACQKL